MNLKPRRRLAPGIAATLAAALLLGLPSRPRAQTMLAGFFGDEFSDYFGTVVDGLGDVNGDGRGDLIVASWSSDAGGENFGLVRIFSGATGALLYQRTGQVPHTNFGWAASHVGDVNGDGRGDFAVGAFTHGAASFEAGAVFVYSGSTGNTLSAFFGSAPGDRLGFSVASAGDVNSDGVLDIIAGAPFSAGAGPQTGLARVVSGANGATLLTLQGTEAGGRFGDTVAGTGDVNGDGRDDLIVGAPYVNQEAGRATVHSGADGALLFTIEGDAPGDQLGRALAGLGDVDGDGRDDFAVGARWSDAGGHNAGDARVFSGATGAVLYTIIGEGGDSLGYAIASVGDMNHDGRPDLLIGSPLYEPPTGGAPGATELGFATLVSGRDGATIYTIPGSEPEDRFGSALASVGDLDGDGNNDFLIGAWGDDKVSDEAGAAWVISGYAPWLNLGLGSAPAGGETPTLAGGGALEPGQTIAISIQGPAQVPVVLVIGLSMIHLPFAGGTLVPAPALTLPAVFTAPTGKLKFVTTWPAGVPSGLGLVIQAWMPTPGGAGLAATNALLALTP